MKQILQHRNNIHNTIGRRKTKWAKYNHAMKSQKTYPYYVYCKTKDKKTSQANRTTKASRCGHTLPYAHGDNRWEADRTKRGVYIEVTYTVPSWIPFITPPPSPPQ